MEYVGKKNSLGIDIHIMPEEIRVGFRILLDEFNITVSLGFIEFVVWWQDMSREEMKKALFGDKDAKTD